MAIPRTGGEILVANLLAQGATHAFCVPGESYLPVLDALYDVRDRLQLLVCRQEGGVAYMAEAYGKLTGRPGIALVTRGPGASNAAIGIHTATQDSTPMIVLVGQVGGDFVGSRSLSGDRLSPNVRQRGQVGGTDRSRGAHPRIRRTRLPRRDVRPAGPGRAGAARGHAGARCGMRRRGARRAASPRHPTTRRSSRHARCSPARRRPLVLVGGSRWDADACVALRRFAEANDASRGLRVPQPGPASTTGIGSYAGDVGIGINPKLAARVRDADVLLVVGERLGEIATSGYTLLEAPTPRQRLIHVHPGADELGPRLPAGARDRGDAGRVSSR